MSYRVVFDKAQGKWIAVSAAIPKSKQSYAPPSGYARMPPPPTNDKPQHDTRVELGAQLSDGERGVILPPMGNIPNDPTALVYEGSGEPRIVPSAALLFFDKLDSIDNELVNAGEVYDRSLHSKNIITRSRISGSTVPNGEWYNELPAIVLLERLKREPGAWSIWNWPGQEGIPPQYLTPDAGFKLSLETALLVPDVSVPHEDALEFKEKYKPELRKLRHHIERLCWKVSHSGFDEALIRIEREEFQYSLEEYIDAVRKPNWKKRVASLDISMNWLGMGSDLAKQITPSLIGAASTLAIHGTLQGALSALGATALAQLSISSSFGLKEAKDGPFAYRARIEKELP